MKRRLSCGLAIVMALVLTVGCQRESTVEKKTKIQTPEGKTTITEKTTIEQTGKNPPPAEK